MTVGDCDAVTDSESSFVLVLLSLVVGEGVGLNESDLSSVFVRSVSVRSPVKEGDGRVRVSESVDVSFGLVREMGLLIVLVWLPVSVDVIGNVLVKDDVGDSLPVGVREFDFSSVGEFVDERDISVSEI